jgi:ubiquinone biosynthesis protein UbiJ
MASTPAKSSNSLHDAKSRLETAIERLEHALASRATVPSAGSAATDELDAARAEIRQLREKNAAVSARLDATIDKVKVLIDD